MIDILVPTYEPNPDHLKTAIRSALNQTEIRWQMLIHDDCSTIDVRAMIEEFLQDPRIRFERSTVRLGIGGNWNASEEQGTNPYVQYLFQDDHWEPRYLELTLQALEQNPSAGFVSAEHHYDCEEEMGVAELYQQVRDVRKNIDGGLHTHDALLQSWIDRQLTPNIIGEPSFVMMRRSLMQEVGPFTEDMPQFLDVEYWLRCLQKSDWVFVKEELGTFRVHSMGASAQNQMSGAGMFDRLECFERLISSLPSGDLRQVAIQSRNRALVTMARKFLKRVSSKQKVSAKSGGMKKFAMRHPFLIGRALLQALLRPTAA